MQKKEDQEPWASGGYEQDEDGRIHFVWECRKCGYVVRDNPPKVCPQCRLRKMKQCIRTEN